MSAQNVNMFACVTQTQECINKICIIQSKTSNTNFYPVSWSLPSSLHEFHRGRSSHSISSTASHLCSIFSVMSAWLRAPAIPPRLSAAGHTYIPHGSSLATGHHRPLPPSLCPSRPLSRSLPASVHSSRSPLSAADGY